VNFDVQIKDEGLRRVLDVVGPQGKAELCEAGAYSLYVAVVRHVLDYARAHHNTASRLGARPTGHFEEAVDSISYGPDGDGSASVKIPIPGFRRVFEPLTITPKNAKALTIPIAAVAYGRRARELEHMGFNLFKTSKRNGGKSGVLYGQREGDDEITPLYALKARVNLPQDRSMLPSDGDMSQAAADGMRQKIQDIRRKAG